MSEAAPVGPGRQQLLQLFAVPLALTEDLLPPETNARIAEWVLHERARSPGVQRSLVGGWHSQPDLPGRQVPELDLLFGRLVEQVRLLHERMGTGPDIAVRFMLQAWATAMDAGDYVQLHDHADAHWSAVYYVDAGDTDESASGRISWVNPVGSNRSIPGTGGMPTVFQCRPRNGLLAVFPGWLRHAVEPYRGQRPRIAVAANIEVQRRA